METVDNDQTANTHGKGRNTGIIIGTIVILTLIAVWLVPGDAPKHADIPLPAAKPTPPTPILSPAPSAASTTAKPPKQMPEGTTAREYIAMAEQSGASMDTLFAQAEDLRKSGQLADAHLLYFKAARQGHPDAALTLAKQADPAFYSADNSLLDAPDITQARKWYLAATEAGDPTAAKLLENLHHHVQTQAAAGDPDAIRLSLQWK